MVILKYASDKFISLAQEQEFLPNEFARCFFFVNKIDEIHEPK